MARSNIRSWVATSLAFGLLTSCFVPKYDEFESGTGGTGNSNSGGVAAVGGRSSVGGSTAVGGNTSAAGTNGTTGGTSSTTPGGTSAIGGASSTGGAGASSAGGSLTTGGSSNSNTGGANGGGGANGVGGTVPSGGTGNTGGTRPTGGSSGLGGSGTATGGSGNAAGGSATGGAPPSTGGAPPSTGGAPPATGGAPTGGTPATGGAPTGGTPATGGAPTGGTPATGGAPTGGTASGGTHTGGNLGTGGLSCSTGTPCGTSCVELATDRNNCGTCGHSCRYATSSCVASKCQPVTLASGQNSGFGSVTQDANYVYWLVSPMANIGAAMRVAKDGSMSPQFLSDTGPISTHIVVLGNIVQWNYHNIDTGYPSGFSYLNLNSLGAPMSITLGNDSYVIAATADANRIYYIYEPGITSGSSIRSVAPTATFNTVLCGGTVNCKVAESYYLAVDGTNAYWVDATGILWKVALAGGAAVQLASWTVTSFSDFGPIAVQNNQVYYQVRSNLMQVPADGTSSPVTVATNVGYPSGTMDNQMIAADSGGVYWVGNDNGVWWLPTGTTTPIAVATNQGTPCSVIADDTTIYWLDFGTGTVMAVAK